MMWIWLSLGAFMAWVLFVDLVWNAETKPEKVEKSEYPDSWDI